jgi:hypothetical protein
VNTPEGYVCSKCNAKNCKLWRQYNTFLEHLFLLCAKCAGEAEDKDVSLIDVDGTIVNDIFGNGPIHDLDGLVIPNAQRPRTDQIGNLIPAVPTEDGTTFWGYTSVPLSGVRWWKSLPTRPNA